MSQVRANNALETMSVRYLSGVGAKVAQKLAKLGVRTVQDVLFHLPRRYEDRTQVVPIASCRVGQQVSVLGTIARKDKPFAKGGRRLLCRVEDDTGAFNIRLIHFSQTQAERLTVGSRILCYGEMRSGYHGLEMVHPEYTVLSAEDEVPLAETLTPIYPATEGVHQLKLRGLAEQALAILDKSQLQEYLPKRLLTDFKLLPLVTAIQSVHKPTKECDKDQLQEGTHPYQTRLVFEELLAHQLSLLKIRQEVKHIKAPIIAPSERLRQQLIEQLPFTLTSAQKRVVQECDQDMQSGSPMMRLVQGDVGSGKTIVAALLVLSAIEAGLQTAVMAPTEILAEQHAQKFTEWLSPLGIQVGWLASAVTAKERQATLAALKSGECALVIGTQALFQSDVAFAQLGLVVVDEQHRFGVEQRLALLEKGQTTGHIPHQVVMTATPIPRTLAMVAYADLAHSIIDELPPGRTPINTVAISDQKRSEVIERIRQACAEGRQAYWVCTLIEESEQLQCQAAQDAALALESALPDLKVALVHGRLKTHEKEAIMSAFKAGEIDVLVATTVIEVGVDVPNASLMVIENPERLGLAQLHQLRGRVGRGTAKSFCVLLYHSPLSYSAKERLAVLRESNDGFYIAQKDLELRGPGELLGKRQKGLMQFRIANIMRDQTLIPEVQKAAEAILQECPEVIDDLILRWIGQNEAYAKV